MSIKRTALLFIPANRPDFLPKALACKAESLIFDLEDAVPDNQKMACRKNLATLLGNTDFGAKEVIVRINSLSGPFGPGDVETALGLTAVDTIMLPKAEPEEAELLCRLIEKSALKIICLIESARGLQLAPHFFQGGRPIDGLMLGAEDLAADMCLTRSAAGEEIAFARQLIALAAYAGSVQPTDTPCLSLKDPATLQADTKRARFFGFTAKAAISPAQVDIIRSLLLPSEEELTRARRVAAAAAEAEKKGQAVFKVDGKMVDRPVINWAMRVLTMAGEVNKGDR